MSTVNETKTVEEFKKRLATLPTIITSITHARKQIGWSCEQRVELILRIDNLTARFAELEAALDAHAVAHNEEQTSKQKEVFTLMLNTHNQEKQYATTTHLHCSRSCSAGSNSLLLRTKSISKSLTSKRSEWKTVRCETAPFI